MPSKQFARHYPDVAITRHEFAEAVDALGKIADLSPGARLLVIEYVAGIEEQDFNHIWSPDLHHWHFSRLLEIARARAQKQHLPCEL